HLPEGVAVGQRAEHERGPDTRKTDKVIEAVAERRKQLGAGGGLEHGDGEDDLEAEPPSYRSKADGAPIRREEVGEAENHDRAHERLCPADTQHSDTSQRGSISPLASHRGTPA